MHGHAIYIPKQHAANALGPICYTCHSNAQVLYEDKLCFAFECSLHLQQGSICLLSAGAGLGCANSGVCVDMAKHLLKAQSNTLCLVISHENLSAGGYIGNERSMLMPLCLFRVSGAAAFISNRCFSIPEYRQLIYNTK